MASTIDSLQQTYYYNYSLRVCMIRYVLVFETRILLVVVLPYGERSQHDRIAIASTDVWFCFIIVSVEVVMVIDRGYLIEIEE